MPDGTIRQIDYPAEAMVLERLENGDFYGFSKELKTPGFERAGRRPRRASVSPLRLAAVRRAACRAVDPIAAELSALSDQLQQIRRATMKLDYQKGPH